jgi:hypothetical protein
MILSHTKQQILLEWFAIAIRSIKERFRQAAIFLLYIPQANYFIESNIFQKFITTQSKKYRVMNVASVDATSEIRNLAILMLCMVRNYKAQKCGNLEYNAVQAIFHTATRVT